MTTNPTATRTEETIAALQQSWILHWDKVEGQDLPPFREVFAEFYDFDADVILFDDFDPQRRVFLTVQDYADAFWPSFQQFASAEHAIDVAPRVTVDDDLAATFMIFIAVLVRADGSQIANRCTNSQVWRCTSAGWRIIRDHTGVEPISIDAARRVFVRGSR